MNLSTRSYAKEHNLAKYYTGNPCPKNHLDERYTLTGFCVPCMKDINKRRNYKKIYHDNSEKMIANSVIWQKQNPEKLRKTQQRYRKNNAAKVNSKNRKRHAKKINACPDWVDNQELINVYLNCPKGYEVDHIIPLINNTVCGLHVPWNLQYLTKEDNLKKGNKRITCYL
jgi:hypothetical protein